VGEGWGEGKLEQKRPSSPRAAPTVGARLWAKPQSQPHRRQKRVGLLQRVIGFGRAAAGPSDTAALRTAPTAGPRFFLSTKARASGSHLKMYW